MALIPEPQGFVRNPLTENLDAAGYNVENAALLSVTDIELETITSIAPFTKIDVEKTLNFRAGHELEFAGDGKISLTSLKLNPQAGTTTNVLNYNTANDRITYEPFPVGSWYDYNAISTVDLANFNLNNVSLITRGGTNTDTCDTLLINDITGTSITLQSPAPPTTFIKLNKAIAPQIDFNIGSSGGLYIDELRIEAPIETGTPALASQILRFDGTTHQWVFPSAYTFGGATISANVGGGTALQVVRGASGTPNIGFIATPSARNTVLCYKDANYTWRSPPVLQYRVQDMFPMDQFQLSGNGSVTGFSTVSNGYWGAVLVPDGRAFLIPYNNTQIGILDTQTNAFVVGGTAFASGGNKWAGGCIAANGLIYCAPATRDEILVINPALDPTDPNFYTTIATGQTGTLKWRGAATDATGRYVVFNPNNSDDVMILDTSNNAVSFISTGLTGNEKYGTAILAPNGLIYHTPANRTTANQLVGVTNVVANTFTTFGTAPVGTSSISRAGVLYKEFIYCPVRTGTSDFYVIDTNANTVTPFGTIASLANRYLGAILGADEKIYAWPYNNDGGALNLQIIDPITNTATYRTLVASGVTSTNNFLDGIVNATGTKMYGIAAQSGENCAVTRLGVPKLFPFEVNTGYNKY
jgi:hypothetical protein